MTGRSGNLVQVAGHGFVNGQSVVFQLDGGDVLPAPLSTSVEYVVTNVASGEFGLVQAGTNVILTTDPVNTPTVRPGFVWSIGDTNARQISVPILDDLAKEGDRALPAVPA